MNTSFKEYVVTLSSGTPLWKRSKWIVAAEEKSQALNYALLLHDDPARPIEDRWSVAMVTLSYRGANPEIDESEFHLADPKYLESLLRIYRHSKERLENC